MTGVLCAITIIQIILRALCDFNHFIWKFHVILLKKFQVEWKMSNTLRPIKYFKRRISIKLSISAWKYWIESFIFLGREGNASRFEKRSIYSPIRYQIAQQFVRLITLIELNKFLIHTISPRSLQKFSWTRFRWCVLRKCEFLEVMKLLEAIFLTIIFSKGGNYAEEVCLSFCHTTSTFFSQDFWSFVDL